MTIEMAVGQEIRFCRIKKGLSQENLAFESSLHRTYISLIERGIKGPTINTIVQLCTALEISPDKFLKHVMQRVAGERK